MHNKTKSPHVRGLADASIRFHLAVAIAAVGALAFGGHLLASTLTETKAATGAALNTTIAKNTPSTSRSMLVPVARHHTP